MSRKGQSLPVMFYLLRPLWVKTRQLQSEKQRPMTLNRDREKPILVMYLYVRRVPKSGHLISCFHFLFRGYTAVTVSGFHPSSLGYSRGRLSYVKQVIQNAIKFCPIAFSCALA
jgi:hypothetical protein